LRYYIETNWPTLGPDLVGKLHFLTGDMDDYYLNLPMYLLEDFLKGTTKPAYGGSFAWGRPMKGHGWEGMTKADLIKTIADRIAKISPAGEDAARWHYR
jgi:hypothetical protein